MRRRSRLLRVARWGGVALSMALFLVWCESYIRMRGWGTAKTQVAVVHGVVILNQMDKPGFPAGWLNVPTRTLHGSPVRIWLPSKKTFRLRSNSTRVIEYRLPLWVPFVIVAIPTVILWRLDRRRRFPPGHCPCGYDLRGNVSGTCPECGVEVQV